MTKLQSMETWSPVPVTQCGVSKVASASIPRDRYGVTAKRHHLPHAWVTICETGRHHSPVFLVKVRRRSVPHMLWVGHGVEDRTRSGCEEQCQGVHVSASGSCGSRHQWRCLKSNLAEAVKQRYVYIA